MKKISTILLLALASLLSGIKLQAQDRIVPIDDYYFPTNNSDFHYFFLRKNSRLKEGLIGTEISYQKNKIISKSKLFIPIYNSKKWNYVIPVYFDIFQFKSSGDGVNFTSQTRNFFFQSVLNYYPNEKSTLTSIIEGRIRGNEESHFEARGNMIAHYLVYKYKFSDKLSISPAILTGHQWNKKNKFVFSPSFELKWNPTPNMAILAGVPGLLGIEWNAPSNFDLVVHSMLDNGALTINGALRKRFNKKFDLTLRYDRDGYGNTYIPLSSFTTSTQTYSYNQINQIENSASVELSFRPTPSLLFQLKGGYNFSSELQLSNNDMKIAEIDGGSGWYSGLALYWRFKK